MGALASVGAVAIIGAVAYGVPAIANAAGSSPSPSTGTSATAPDFSRHMSAEAELSGATAAKVRSAVLAKLPGATILRMSAEDSREGAGAAYEAHVKKADGTMAEVLLDKSFKVTTVRAGGFHGGFGGRHGGNEAELTGTTASKVKAAVQAKVPGATVDRMSAEDAAERTGAAYEAHVTKADGTHVEVLLDKNFTVISTRTAPAGGRGFGGHFGDGPGTAPPSGSGASVGPADFQALNA